MSERSVFLAALEREDPLERASYLDRACAGNTGLRQQVEELLRLHAAGGSYLETPALEQGAARPAQPDHTEGSWPFLPVGENVKHDQPEALCQTQAEKGSAGSEEKPLHFLQPSRKPGSLGRLDHYEILEVVGKGAFGIVLKAFDEVLHRVIAIKVLAPQLASNGTARRRFIREAQAAAAVSHDHVVTIHAVEEGKAVPYLVMQYVAGLSLQEKIDKAGPLQLREILRIGMQIANGLAAAHAQGLIHRDVKPSNILLENGVERVKITDFGLARAVDDASLTKSGTIAGTPAYMSPEQADGQALDHRSDLFSLGSVLYAMCTGRPPFRAASTMAVLRRVCDDVPRPIREINPEIPEWLEQVVGRLHAKKPADRFSTSAEVANVLARQLAHLQQPSLASHPHTEVTLKPAASQPEAGPTPVQPRRRLPGAASVLVGALLLTGGLAVAFLLQRRPEPDTGNLSGPGGDSPTRPALFTLDLKRDQIPPDLLARAGGGDAQMAPPELAAILGDRHFLMPRAGRSSWMDQSPDGRLLAVPCGDAVILFDADKGLYLRSLMGHNGKVYTVAFSPDGKQLAGGNWDGDNTILLWDVHTGRVLQTFRGHTNLVCRVAFSRDGQRLLSSSDDRLTMVWEVATGRNTLTLSGHTDPVRSVSYSPDGKHILSGSSDTTVRVWDAVTGAELQTLRGHDGVVLGLAFSPDGKWLASGSEKDLRIWEAQTYREVKSLPAAANWLAFTPDSKAVLAGSHYPKGPAKRISRWAVGTWNHLGDLEVPGPEDWTVFHLSTDGKTLFALPINPPAAHVMVLDAVSGKERFSRAAHMGPVNAVAFSPDGRLLASGGIDHTVRVWDMTSWKPGTAPLHVLSRHADKVWSLAFSPDGKTLVSGSFDGTIALWDVATGAEVRTLTGHARGPANVTFSPDGKTLAGGTDDGLVKLWDAASAKPRDPLAWHSKTEVRGVAISPDGTLLASASYDHTVQLCDPSTGRRLHTFKEPGSGLVSVAFSPDGKWLASGSTAPDFNLRLYNLATKEERVLKLSGAVTRVVFQPKGQMIAACTSGGAVYFWDFGSPGQQVLTLGPGPFGPFLNGVALTPDGRYLAVGNADGAISILRVPTPPVAYAPGSPGKIPEPAELAGRTAPADALKRADIPPLLLARAGGGDPEKASPELVAVLGEHRFVHPGPVKCARISPDGKLIATTYADMAEARVWDATTGQELFTVKGHNARVAAVAFSRDGKLLATSSADKTAKVWDLESKKDIATLTGHTDLVRAVCFSPDGKRLATAGHDLSAKVWDWKKGEVLLSLEGHTSGLTFVTFSPDGKKVATTATDGSLRVWDAATGKELVVCRGHIHEWVRCVAFSPNGEQMVSVAQLDGTARVWDTVTGKELFTLSVSGARGSLLTVSWSGDGTRIAAAGECGKQPEPGDTVIHVWDARTKAPVASLQGHNYAVESLEFAGDNKRLVGAGQDGTVRIWDLAAGWDSRRQHVGQVQAVAISPNGRILASGGRDGLVRLWDLANGQLRRSLPGNQGYTLAFSPDGKVLAGGTHGATDAKVVVWDVETGKVVHTLATAGTIIPNVTFSVDGTMLAAAAVAPEAAVHLWDAKTGRPLRKLQCDGQPPWSVAFSPDGKTLASGHHDGTVRLWDTATGWELGTLRGHKDVVRWLAFSPDGRTLASAGQTNDRTVRLWDLAAWKPGEDPPIKILERHTDGILSGAWRADGRLLASAGHTDGTIRVWDPGSNPPRSSVLSVIPPGNPFLHCVALSPEGRYLATANPDGTVYILRLADLGQVFRVLPAEGK
jgi:WD40 repeat protein/serine/threonine protein kinase